MSGRYVYKNDFLFKVAEIVKKCTHNSELVLFYTGDGLIVNGNWVLTQKYVFDMIKDFTVSLNDIFEIMENHQFQGRLVLISDCSHSGQWCY